MKSLPLISVIQEHSSIAPLGTYLNTNSDLYARNEPRLPSVVVYIEGDGEEGTDCYPPYYMQ